MRSRLNWIGVAGLALGLAACGEQGATSDGHLALSGDRYCAPFKSSTSNAAQPAAFNSGDPAAVFEDCVHRWGYTLAPARDPADVVAQAAVDACGPLLNAWNQQTLGETGQSSPSSNAGPGNEQGQPNPMEQRMRMVEARALFYVVQARAAGCAPPPASSLYAGAAPPSG